MSASMQASTSVPQSQAAQMPEIPANEPRADGTSVSAVAGANSEKTKLQRGVDQLYEEKIQEEYAKREGGA